MLENKIQLIAARIVKGTTASKEYHQLLYTLKPYGKPLNADENAIYHIDLQDKKILVFTLQCYQKHTIRDMVLEILAS